MNDILDKLPEDTEANGYPRTEYYLQMDVFKGISGLIDRAHYEHAQAWATLELAEVNYRAALAAERQAAALERIADSVNSIDGVNLRIEDKLGGIEIWLEACADEQKRIAAVLESVKSKVWVEEGYVDCLYVNQPRV